MQATADGEGTSAVMREVSPPASQALALQLASLTQELHVAATAFGEP